MDTVKPNFWDQLGVNEGGLPVHMPMGVTFDGEGPEDDALAHHYVCWCSQDNCPLDKYLLLAFDKGCAQAD